MKTVTVTTQNVLNYGAVLQAYAFQQVLYRLGAEDALLDLDTHNESYYRKLAFDHTLPSSLYNNWVRYVRKKDMMERAKKFRAFIKDYLIQTKRYPAIDAVLADPPQADAYITGGDQMFNRSCLDRPTNLLAFGDAATKRVSYATSLGENWFVGSEKASQFKRALSAYSAISLREHGSKAALESLIGKPVSVNIDPVLLLDKQDWEDLCTETNTQRYILCYSLLNNEKLNGLLLSQKKRLGLPVWVINPNPRCYVRHADRIIYNAGPIDFLNLISGADEVISTSFHGVCFSVLFEKPFFCLTRGGGDIRYESLLQLLDLQDRDASRYGGNIPSKIDYAPVRNILENERVKALQYLKGALSL